MPFAATRKMACSSPSIYMTVYELHHSFEQELVLDANLVDFPAPDAAKVAVSKCMKTTKLGTVTERMMESQGSLKECQ